MNLLLIAIDTLRADRLGCYGYPKPTSPTMDQLASQGVRFANCFSQSNCTTPGFATIFSGLYPISHGVVELGGDLDDPEGCPWLPRILKEHGYRTVSVSNLPSKDFFRNGYDEWELWDKDHPVIKALGDKPTRSQLYFAQAMALLEELRDRKFFLFVHSWDPHTPYQPPEEFNVFYQGKDPKDPANRSLETFRKGALGNWFESWTGLKNVAHPGITDAEYFAALYDAEVRTADFHVSELLARLDELGLAENTIVVLTSDHGETLTEPNNFICGQQCFYGHLNLYDPDIHIPLIIRAPGKVPESTLVEELVQQIDIAPTILDLLDIKHDADFDGISLLPAIEGQPTYDYIFTLENTYQRRRAVRSKTWKYMEILDGHLKSVPRAELYHLESDPDELMNVVDLEPEIADQMQLELDRWVQRLIAKWEKPGDPQILTAAPHFLQLMGRYQKKG